jgi:RNA polymerase sigma factor (sigma-70 family)
MTADSELLRRFAENHSEDAFAELVERHLNLVYSAALRQVNGDAHLAQDVAQSVFADLARKAAPLSRHAVLTGWLYTSTHFAATKAVRAEQRRHAREQEAHLMRELLHDDAPEPHWNQLAPVLDAAMQEIKESDREVILLRYFENRSLAEIGSKLGLSENAARMRVERAVEKLHTCLVRRGVTTTAAALSIVISSNAVHVAPTGLATTLASASLASAAAGTGTTLAVFKWITMTTLQKTLIATTLVAAVGVVVHQTRQTSQLREQVQTLQRSQTRAESNETAFAALQEKIDQLTVQNVELTNALAQVTADKTRIEAEREQARRSTALYRQLIEQANAKDSNPTNEYSTPRHVWAAFGKFGRLSALDKEPLSSEEKSALDAAKMKAIEEMPRLFKAAKQMDAAKAAGTESSSDDHVDQAACLLYGALNLDEQQFGQVYGLIQKYQQEAAQKGLSWTSDAPENVLAYNQIIEQVESEITGILTPEQAKIFTGLLTLVHFEPGKTNSAGFNFNF